MSDSAAQRENFHITRQITAHKLLSLSWGVFPAHNHKDKGKAGPTYSGNKDIYKVPYVWPYFPTSLLREHLLSLTSWFNLRIFRAYPLTVTSPLTGRCFRSTLNRSSNGTCSMAQKCEAEAFSPTIGYKKRIGEAWCLCGLMAPWLGRLKLDTTWVQVLRVPLPFSRLSPPHYLENTF